MNDQNEANLAYTECIKNHQNAVDEQNTRALEAALECLNLPQSHDGTDDAPAKPHARSCSFNSSYRRWQSSTARTFRRPLLQVVRRDDVPTVRSYTSMVAVFRLARLLVQHMLMVPHVPEQKALVVVVQPIKHPEPHH